MCGFPFASVTDSEMIACLDYNAASAFIPQDLFGPLMKGDGRGNIR